MTRNELITPSGQLRYPQRWRHPVTGVTIRIHSPNLIDPAKALGYVKLQENKK